MIRPDIAVVFLANLSEGEKPISSFFLSYLSHPAGTPHDLYIAWKGIATNENAYRQLSERISSSIPSTSIYVPDIGVDITAYQSAARSVTQKRVLFLNTFSTIECDDWLLHLDTALGLPSVGLVGATASYESVLDSFKHVSRIMWSCQNGAPYDPVLAAIWGHEIIKYVPTWFGRHPRRRYFLARLMHLARSGRYLTCH